jgi:hypothetical protein
MSNFMMLGGFLIIPMVISFQAFPAYIIQFLIVRFVGKQYRFILPALSLGVMLLFGIIWNGTLTSGISNGRLSVVKTVICIDQSVGISNPDTYAHPCR